MPVSKVRKRQQIKKQNGQHHRAGRFAFVVLLLCLGFLASSTMSDPLSTLVQTGVIEESRKIGIHDDLSDWQSQARLALFRRVAAQVDAVRHLSHDDLQLLFGEPDLVRHEGEKYSWHFTSGECALDIYFARENANYPSYAEYRVRGEVRETGFIDNTKSGALDHRSCVRSLFVAATD